MQRAHYRARSFLFWLVAICASAAAYAGTATPTLRYEVIARYAHSTSAFTQGLELSGDTVYESSGRYGYSYITRWPLPAHPATSKQTLTPKQTPAQKQTLPSAVFGEGLTLWGGRIYVLTWREQRGFIFDKNTLNQLGEFSYSGEGWGLTHNERSLILSDGTDTLRFLDPQTLRTEKTIGVSEDKKPIDKLNELEWVPARATQPARLLANIWQSDEIVVIDSDSGQVTARIDLGRLYPKSTRSVSSDVLNGIAFDPRDQTLLITGKYWPYVYRIRVLDALP